MEHFAIEEAVHKFNIPVAGSKQIRLHADRKRVRDYSVPWYEHNGRYFVGKYLSSGRLYVGVVPVNEFK